MTRNRSFDAADKPAAVAPVFKWPGGKRSLVASISALINRPYARLVEPFCGGAALFFHTRPDAAILADRNAELINAYIQIRDDPEPLIGQLNRMPNSEKAYYRIRSTRPRTELARAARFIYLMRLSFNGIYRENLRGEFNVPYGYKVTFKVCDEDNLRSASKALQGAQCFAQSYPETLESTRSTDVVYIDPPYTVSHNNNGFVKYNRTLFSWEDQKKLAAICERVRRQGAVVIVSNADHDEIRALYPKFDHHQVNRFCSISGFSHGRKRITESLLVGK